MKGCIANAASGRRAAARRARVGSARLAELIGRNTLSGFDDGMASDGLIMLHDRPCGAIRIGEGLETRWCPKPMLLTVGEASQNTRVTPLTIYRWCWAGKIRARKVGGVWRIYADKDGLPLPPAGVDEAQRRTGAREMRAAPTPEHGRRPSRSVTE